MDAVTVQVDATKHPRAVLMIWEKLVKEADVKMAFREIDHILNTAPEPMVVIVDIAADPIFPLSATLQGALFGPHRNPNMLGWIVVGTNPVARIIESTLSRVSRSTSIYWVNSREEALVMVEALLAKSA
jgi:hypothetical protein